ncbi:hypothetical protein ACVWZM_000519 [Bradyrhizobium sp. USDA 4501]
MLQSYIKVTEILRRLRTDKDGVVSFEYVIVAALYRRCRFRSVRYGYREWHWQCSDHLAHFDRHRGCQRG